MSSDALLWGLLFGSIGLGYLVYGRRQRRTAVAIAGLGLLGFPYFVDNTVATILIGAALLAAPFVVKL